MLTTFERGGYPLPPAGRPRFVSPKRPPSLSLSLPFWRQTKISP